MTDAGDRERSGAGEPMSRLHDLEFDPRSGEIWRAGRPVDLAPQPTRLFTLLARRPGRLVTRDEIRREIWGDAAVDIDTAINNAIREIRDALGDDASDPRYIETVPRRGYRLIAEVEERRPAWLWPAGALAIVTLALWLLPALLGSGGGPPTITVVPVRAGEAGSAADRVAERLTRELEAAVQGFDDGELTFVRWEGVVEYDRAAGRILIDGEPVEVDLGLDANVTEMGDSLRVAISVIGFATASQLWHRVFQHPVADTSGLVRRVRERVVEELEARVGARTPLARVDTVAGGWIQVTNTGVGAWTDETAWRLEEDFRLGAATGPEAELFGSIVSITSDSRERIYVLDWQAQEIRVFLDDGTFSHTLGRRGEGPGELEGAWALTVGAGDTLTVLDDGNMRYSVFAPDGTFVESHRRDIVGYGPPRRASLADGSYLDWGIASPDGRMGPRTLFYPIRYAPGLERADTFPPIEHRADMVAGGRMPLLDYGRFPVAAVDARGGIWFADSGEYVIVRRTLGGDTTLVFDLPVEAVALGETEREAVRSRWAERPDILTEQLEALPGTLPVVYGIVPDNAGHLLVFIDVPGERRGTAVDVFRQSGQYLGRMTLPRPVPLTPNRPPVVHVAGEHLYAAVRGEMDVPVVVRWRILR